jgi:hypothetical protein
MDDKITTMNTLLTQGSLFFQGSKKTIIFSSLTVFTLILEEIFESVVFRCPCENHLFYGLLFLVGPAAILFVAGILLNSNTWWFFSLRKVKRQRKELNCTCKHSKQRRCCQGLVIIGEILCKALISPTIWLILSFLQKTFFVCAAFGPVTKRGNPRKDATANVTTPCANIKPRSLNEEAELIAKSQTIGLVLSLTATVIVLILAFVSQCCGYKSKLCLPDEKFYMRLEAIEAAKEFNKRAKKKAQNQGRKMVNQVFEGIDGQDQDNYLVIISKAGQILDEKYSRYFNSSLRITEENCDNSGEQNTRAKVNVSHCRYEEDLEIKSSFFVDGKIDSAECETEMATETHTNIVAGDHQTRGTHAQSSTTRICFRRAKSMK